MFLIIRFCGPSRAIHEYLEGQAKVCCTITGGSTKLDHIKQTNFEPGLGLETGQELIMREKYEQIGTAIHRQLKSIR